MMRARRSADAGTCPAWDCVCMRSARSWPCSLVCLSTWSAGRPTVDFGQCDIGRVGYIRNSPSSPSAASDSFHEERPLGSARSMAYFSARRRCNGSKGVGRRSARGAILENDDAEVDEALIDHDGGHGSDVRCDHRRIRSIRARRSPPWRRDCTRLSSAPSSTRWYCSHAERGHGHDGRQGHAHDEDDAGDARQDDGWRHGDAAQG